MKKVTLLITVILIVIPSFVIAQNSKEQALTQKTTIEKFSAETGVVIVRGFEEVGTVNGLYNTSITLDSKEFINAATGKKAFGITVQVIKIEGKYKKENTSFVDYDEIESLIAGIDYISKIDNTVTTFSNFQADYKTRGNFVISTLSSDKKIMVAISSGSAREVNAYYNFSSLPEIKEIFVKAKAKIDALKK